MENSKQNTEQNAVAHQQDDSVVINKGKAIPCPLPENCSLHEKAKGRGYEDAFAFRLEDDTQDARSVYLAIFGKLPKPVRFMISLRNKLVGLFGFETSPEGMNITADKITEGAKAGAMTILKATAGEVIVGSEERHMAVWISLQNHEDGLYTLSTRVNLHTGIGRAYMKVIKPFHKVIAAYSIESAFKAGRLS